ncbi:kunitz-type protease inhibitor 2 [Bombyx mori]|uniref:kunitz-type protease inhibitor 2 n=1 Tax=Bombyx mori TaxID=7091 RepID=UPI00034F328B
MLTGNLPKKYIKDPLNRNVVYGWGGWTPSPVVQKQWAEWLDNYKKTLNSTKGKEDVYDPEAGGSSLWKDLGPGSSDLAPPWSYAPRNIGLPDYCYQIPERGYCEKNIIRWAFNPFRNECVKFIYSGCGENQNNFSEKLRCEQSCMNPPIFGCEMDPEIYDTGFQSRKCN